MVTHSKCPRQWLTDDVVKLINVGQCLRDCLQLLEMGKMKWKFRENSN